MPPSFRIVSLVPSLTDLCFAMGLGPYVVGRTDYCISPADKMPNITSVGGPKSVDAAAFRLLAPTHVLVCPEENSRDIIPLAESCGTQLVSVAPKTPQDNHELFRKFAETFSCDTAAQNLSHELELSLKIARECKANTPERTALPLIWREPWMALGPDTYGAAMLASVGIKVPKIADDRYPMIKDLAAVAQTVDGLILTTEPYTFTADHITETQAIAKHGNVHLIPGEALAWYGSHAINALIELSNFKHEF